MIGFVDDPFLAWINDALEHARLDHKIEPDNKEFSATHITLYEARKMYLILTGRAEFP